MHSPLPQAGRRSRKRSVPALLAVLAVVLAVGPGQVPASRPAAARAPVRGMTISCQTWGWEWATDEMVQEMRALKALGVNWIAIHPYAGIRGDGSVVMASRWYGRTDWVTRPIREAHELGLKIMIKPHLAYWGSPFRWRGEIVFQTEEQWQRFFEGYRAWITRVAEVAAGADAFVVGTELDRTVHRDEWRGIVDAVRATLGPGVPLTYAANWTDYEQVPFWDLLDVIGIQAYFPLAAEPGVPEPGALDRAWAGWLGRLEAFARRRDRRILFSELGYALTPGAAVEPWSGREGGEGAQETQKRCLESALRALERSDQVVGAFLWKWFAGPAHRENFLMSTPAMREVIAAHWGPPT